MDQLVQVPVGEAGRTFVMEALGHIPGLASELHAAVRAGGSFSAVLPEGTSRAKVEDVSAGYLTGLDESIPWLARYLAAIAASKRKGALIVQDLWIRPNELINPPPDLRQWNFEGQVYVWASLDEITADKLEALVGETLSHVIALFLVLDDKIVDDLITGLAAPNRFAPKVAEIYVAAYDRESFLIWSRRDQAS